MDFKEAVSLKVKRASDAPCYLCGRAAVQRHHIVGGSGKRKSCETQYSRLYLCFNCHEMITNNYAESLKLKLLLQDLYFELGHTGDEVRRLMGGKIYG